MSNIKTYHINRYLYSYCAFETKNFPIKARALTVVPFEYIILNILLCERNFYVIDCFPIYLLLCEATRQNSQVAIRAANRQASYRF